MLQVKVKKWHLVYSGILDVARSFFYWLLAKEFDGFPLAFSSCRVHGGQGGWIDKLAFNRSTFCQRDLLSNHDKLKQCQIGIVAGDVCIILILF